ncbi:DNA helicase [Thecaphora frezii]
MIRSGLGSLKRSWSGNSHDLGEAVEPDVKQKQLDCASSQEIFYEWSDTPSPPSSPRIKASSTTSNALERDAKRRKSGEHVPAPQAAKPPAAATRDGFVLASSLAPTRVQSFSASPYSRPGSDLVANFSRARSGLLTDSLRTNAPAASGSASYLKSATQLKEERRMANSSGSLASSLLETPSLGQRPKVPSKVFLSAEQRAVLDMVVREKKNVFFTGSAGTGKSVLLREIIKELKQVYHKKPDAVAVTASTGIAACNIGGVTLHSFSGIGLGKESPAQLVTKIRRNRKAIARWLRTQVLIMDEISMVDPDLFDKLEEVARIVRKNSKPFGGLQVVITGDFFQLPPVNPGGGMTFAFEASSWDSVVVHKVNLTKVFRQKDSRFVTMLNEMRFGQLSPETIRSFKALERAPVYEEGIVPTELFPRREEVDRANHERLLALPTKAETFPASDGGSLDPTSRERVLQNFIALKSLTLKVGAQVMLIKNVDETLVNGSIGLVLDFIDEREYMERGLGRGEDKEDGNKLNALNRASQRKWPLVRFKMPNGGFRDYLAKPESWKNELPTGEVQAARTQVPLILAWAMSIHKSQGQTLQCCRINLNRVFEKGQAYVALSRATSLEGLQVMGFNPAKVMAHPKVIAWSRSLAGVTAGPR